MTFKAATCPSCGGALQVNDDRATVECMYCGVEVIVREAVQAAAVGNVDNWLKIARAATRAGNHHEAYVYFTRVLEVDAGRVEAWFGKGEAAGRLSLPEHFRLPEMMTNIEHAVECTSAEQKESIRARAAQAINNAVAGYYQILRQRLNSVIGNDNAWADYSNQLMRMIAMLEQAHQYDPQATQVMHGIVALCIDNLSGIPYTDPYVRDRKGRLLHRRRLLHPHQQSILGECLNRYSGILRTLDPTYRLPVYKDENPGVWASIVQAVQRLQNRGLLPASISAETILILSGVGMVFLLMLIVSLGGANKRYASQRPMNTQASTPVPGQSSTNLGSPEKACSYLNESGLKTRGYKYLKGEYGCTSPDKNIGTGYPLANTIAYYVTGDLQTVKALALVLKINNRGAAAAAHQALVETSEKLSINATGTTLQADIRKALSQGEPGKWEAGKNRVEVVREDWPTGKGYEVKFIIK